MTSPSAWAPYEELRKQAIDTAVSYLPISSRRGQSAEVRKSNQTTIMKLRDSLIYRSEAIIWHVTLLSRMQDQAVAKLYSTFPNPNASYDIMRATAREQQFVFDDVVFNCITLFDYIANMVGFAYYGDRTESKMGPDSKICAGRGVRPSSSRQRVDCWGRRGWVDSRKPGFPRISAHRLQS